MKDWPRVTRVLEAVGLGPDLSMVPADVLTAAQKRGTAVHEAIEALAYGYFEDCDAAITPYLDAYKKFMAESGHTAIASEIEVAHPEWKYIGHPDRVGWMLKHRIVIDFKTGETDGVAYQLAAYAEAWNAQHPTEKVSSAAVVELRDTGAYRFTEIDLPAARPVWFAALTVYRAQPGRNGA